MYTVSVRRHFDAAHALRGYAGKCERRHGHRFEVVVSVQRCQLDSIGLALDYGIIKRELDSVLALLDHTDLNETPPFDEINPSSEHIAAYIHDQMAARLGGPIDQVQVYESPDAWVTYTPDA
ncbi:MAG: 6-carboxytetrahydropterin synthase [Chloroflexi bacterium]|nr:6-carboxytetrahydropterin synthase [Chloroflexota bacterium]